MFKLQFIKTCLFICFLFLYLNSKSQSIYFNNNAKENHIIERLLMMQIKNTNVNLGTFKPYQRNEVISFLQIQDSAYRTSRDKSNIEYSAIDLYNINSILQRNTLSLNTIPDSFKSKKSLFNNFFTTKANFYEVNQKDFKLVINPVIQQLQGFDVGAKKHMFLNAKGLEMSGLLGNKIGFYTYLTDNQENGPLFYRQRVDSLKAVQGAGFYKRFKAKPNGTFNGHDYFDYRGYITFKLAKVLNVQYGYDKNFIGDGYRSLFLSDQTAPTLFLKLNTKVWKLDYTNLFMELNPTFTSNTGGGVLTKKYAAMHHLSININENFKLGLFESVIFKRRSKFEFGYLVPVIFLRAVESGLGSGDNALLGMDVKGNISSNIQLYGQVILDEFNMKEITKKSWANKIGVQAGIKYFNVIDIKNLDFQLEFNVVRPYTYSHFDSATTYTHYNQPLAHPLGANFVDVVSVLRYQPKPKLFFEGRIAIMQQGQDSSLLSRYTAGGNIFRQYNDRPLLPEYPLIATGVKTKTINLNINGSYEIRPNFFLEGNIQFRRFDKEIYPIQNTLAFSAGIRWNMNRRDFDY
jgi:hypothetical protein